MASRKKMESIGDYYYDKKDILGHGAFAIVFKGYKKQRAETRASHHSTRTPAIPVAVKCIAKKELSKSKELLAKEISVLRKLSTCQHENVVALLDVKETDSSVYLMIEYCNGGDLADYLHSKGTLSEDTLSSFMQQIASALNSMNDYDIVHRDMKPQNILICFAKGGSKLTTPPTELQLKIADFGFARFLEEGKMAGTLCGSPMYMAPEVIMSHKYDSKADLWSVGTIMFQCLTGKAPFHANTPQQLRAFYEKTTDLKPKVPENTSPELKDMLLRLLTRDAAKRICIKDLIQHPFLKRFKRKPHRDSRDSQSSSPIATRRRTTSLSSDSSGTPGSGREVSPLARQPAVDPDKDMVSTLTASNDDDGFTKVEKPDTRPETPEDFVLVPSGIPEYTGATTGEKKMRAPLAEEELDTFDESVTASLRPVKLSADDGKVTFRREQRGSPTHSSSPRLPSPSSPPLVQRSGGGSAPIPVPSLSRVASMPQREMASKSASPAKVKRRSVSSGASMERDPEMHAVRRNSDIALAPPDVTQVAPPSVQFSIGTPPNTGGIWKRTTGTNFGSCPTARADGLSTSPLRRSASCSPGTCIAHYGSNGSIPSSLPVATSTPTKHCNHHHPPYPTHHPPSHHHQYCGQEQCGAHDLKFQRYPTVPDCTALVPCSSAREELSSGLEACHRCGTEPDLRPFHMLRAYASHRQHEGLGALVPFASGRDRGMSQGSDKVSPSALEHDHSIPINPRRNSSYMDSSPPPSSMCTGSPHTVDMGYIALEPPYEPPELSEDTLMDEEHNRMSARLAFLLDVAEIIVDMARAKNAVCNPMAESISVKRPDNLTPAQYARFTDTQRILEQLVLYLRAVHLMAQSREMAEQALKEEKMVYIKSVQKLLQDQNDTFRFCVEECKRLYSDLREVCSTKLDEPLIAQHADKLIYNYAVEECQAGAMEELTGNKCKSHQRYQRAYVLLHSLCQWVDNGRDKMLLEKYCKSVEQRLKTLGQVNTNVNSHLHQHFESCAS